MKRRQSFVSNSSSTSFCIFGYVGDYEAAVESIERTLGKPFDTSEFEEEYGLVCLFDESCDEVIIGKSIFDMKDDETLRQFKERAAEETVRATGLDPKGFVLAVDSVYL